MTEFNNREDKSDYIYYAKVRDMYYDYKEKMKKDIKNDLIIRMWKAEEITEEDFKINTEEKIYVIKDKNKNIVFATTDEKEIAIEIQAEYKELGDDVVIEEYGKIEK